MYRVGTIGEQPDRRRDPSVGHKPPKLNDSGLLRLSEVSGVGCEGEALVQRDSKELESFGPLERLAEERTDWKVLFSPG